jgi:4'-phosphopantetheinyl transferase
MFAQGALTIWEPAPPVMSLAPGEVHVWHIRLDHHPYVSDQLARILSADEHERAARIRRTRDQQRWIVCRGTLRQIAGHYLDLAPEGVLFEYGLHGKPQVSSTGRIDLEISISHSEDHALLAFAPDRELGVDLEVINEIIDPLNIAERFFPPDETDMIRELSGDARLRAFLRCWTAKEAYLKARGLGLSVQLNQVRTPFANHNQVRVRDGAEPVGPRDWSLLPIDPGPDIVSTLAVPGGDFALRCWTLQTSLQAE